MKVRKLKTRIAAFGLAVLMGISTLSSANAFAAEQTGSEQQTEVQASEQAVTSQKDTSVTADDITKAVSDETFAVETSMEGIHYNAEKEDVTLVSIKDENGGEYHSDKAGTYIATYMVVPKDKSDSYTITRKVTLTDTEGQAHSEENGGEKQKSDTESEDDSDSPVQNYTDVEIETSEEDASAQAIKELKKCGVKKTIMLTGDRKNVADYVAKDLGIQEVYSELLPGDKVSKVEALLANKTEKEKLAFVGDGINDAPVLSRADVGIAMGAMGSDAAIEAADIVLMDDDPLKIATAIHIARKCIRIVYENIYFAIGIKLICLLLGALGIANMWMAIFADVGVMVIAVLNAIRALFVKKYEM